MKLLTALVVVLVATGCTSLKPVDMSPDQLQDRISTGQIIQVGDSVKLVTADGKQHKFTVTSITGDHVGGKDIEVPIADIVAVESREFSGGKTAALAGGTSIIAVIVILIVGLGASL